MLYGRTNIPNMNLHPYLIPTHPQDNFSGLREKEGCIQRLSRGNISITVQKKEM